jgi:hypothetical protein
LALTSSQQRPFALTTIEAEGELSWYVAVPPLDESSTAG